MAPCLVPINEVVSTIPASGTEISRGTAGGTQQAAAVDGHSVDDTSCTGELRRTHAPAVDPRGVCVEVRVPVQVILLN